MTDEELIKVLYEHCDRLIATVDELGEPFRSLGTIRLSAERKDGVERKIILWLEPEPLDDNWEPLEANGRPAMAAFPMPSFWRRWAIDRRNAPNKN